MKPLTKAYICLVAAPLVWGTNFVAAQYLVAQVQPLVLTVIRLWLASGIFALAVRPNFKLEFVNRTNMVQLVVMGLCGAFLFNFLLYIGLTNTSAINSAIINALLPALTMGMAVVFLKEKGTFRQVTGIIISLLGVSLIILHGSFTSRRLELHSGDLLVLLATLAWAVYTIMGKPALTRMSPLEVSAYSTIVGGIIAMPLGLWLIVRYGLPAMTIKQAVMVLYVGIVPPVFGPLLWNRGVQVIGPSRAGLFYNLLPVFTSLLAVEFLHDSLQWYHWAGGITVFLGVYLGSRLRATPSEPKTAGF